MKKLAILLIFSLIPAMSFSEEEIIYDNNFEALKEEGVDGGATIALGLMVFNCYSLLYNFDITKTDKEPEHDPNTEDDEYV